MDKRALSIVWVTVVAIYLLATAAPANALCSHGWRTEVVGQVADVHFPGGIDSQKTISLTYNSRTVPGAGTCALEIESVATAVLVSKDGASWSQSVASSTDYLGDHTSAFRVRVLANATAAREYVLNVLDWTNDVPGPADKRLIGTIKVYVGSSTPVSSFVHTVTTASRSGDSSYIDHPWTNFSAGTRLLITPLLDARRPVYNKHRTGVWYDSGLSRWAIFNEDGARMPVGAKFNVRIEGPDDYFATPIHTTTSSNIYGDGTILKDPPAVANGYALVFATHNLNPSPGVPGYPGYPCCVYHNHNVGLYNATSEWWIVNQDYAGMSVNVNFNLRAFGLPGPGVFGHVATTHNTSRATTTINDPATNGIPGAILIVTPNWTVGGGVDFDKVFAVRWKGARWTIRTMDGSPMPANAGFNIYVPQPAR
jgi:hypothetical protein